MKKKYIFTAAAVLAIILGIAVYLWNADGGRNVSEEVTKAISLLEKTKEETMKTLEIEEGDLQQELPMIYMVSKTFEIADCNYHPYLEFDQEGEDAALIRYGFVLEDLSDRQVKELTSGIFEQVSEKLGSEKRKSYGGEVQYADGTRESVDASILDLSKDGEKLDEIQSGVFTEVWENGDQKPFQVLFTKRQSESGTE